MTLPFTLPDWLPWWVPIVVLVPALLWLLAFLFVPFSVLGTKTRLEGIEARLDELHGELRTLALRLPEAPTRLGYDARGYEELYAAPPRPPPAPVADDLPARPPIPPPNADWYARPVPIEERSFAGRRPRRDARDQARDQARRDHGARDHGARDHGARDHGARDQGMRDQAMRDPERDPGADPDAARGLPAARGQPPGRGRAEPRLDWPEH